MSTEFIESIWKPNACFLDVNQIPEYPHDLRVTVRGLLSEENFRIIETQFYNQVAPGQLIAAQRVVDFIIYTSVPQRAVFRTEDTGFFSWSFIADAFRSHVQKAFQSYYRVSVNTANIVIGLERLADESFPFKTQKVRGMAALLSQDHATNHNGLDPLGYSGLALLRTAIVLPYQTDARHLSKPFVRPCPSRPRHGFVDSAAINTPQGINVLYQRAKIEDPDAEMIVMQQANGCYSALSVPNILTLAYGFSGCTAGSSHCVSIPHSPVQYSGLMLEQAGITDTPYIEYVEHDSRMMPVQLRDGPPVDGGQSNYIPHDVPPDAVLLHCGSDLIAYEQQLKAADPKESVVLGFGKALTSHYGAHAISYGIPFITDPKLSDCLSVGIKKNIVEDRPARYREIATRLKALMQTPLADHAMIYNPNNGHVTDKLSRSVAYALTVAHMCPVWPKDRKDLNSITADGLFQFIGAFAAALMGELRHLKAKTHNGMWVRVTKLPKFRFQPQRDGTFGHATLIPVCNLVKGLAAVEVDFLYSSWSTSYGGGPWAAAAMSLHILVSRAHTFMAQPDVNTWGALLRDWHTCINEQHNGGYVLNKFVSTAVFNTASDKPTDLILTYKKIYEYYLREVGVVNGAPLPSHKKEEGKD